MRTAISFVAGAVLCAAGLSFAAEQPILGKYFSVSDPRPGVDATKRRVDVAAAEKGSSVTLVGNPTLEGSAGGAILELFAYGATSSNQVFVLPQGTNAKGKPYWTAKAEGAAFVYSDIRGDQGPVRSVQFKRTSTGAVGLKIQLFGKNGAINVVPPNAGTSACAALKLGTGASAGDRYSVMFGPESKLSNSARSFRAGKPTLVGACAGAAGPVSGSATSAHRRRGR